MGSHEGAEAVRAEENELGVMEEGGTGVPAPSNPLPPDAKQPGTPPGPPPKSPEELSVDVVAESPAKKSRKEAVKETQENLATLTKLVQDTVKGMQDLKESVLLTNQQQQQLQSELDKLAAQIGTDSVSTRVIYNTERISEKFDELCVATRRRQKRCPNLLQRGPIAHGGFYETMRHQVVGTEK